MKKSTFFVTLLFVYFSSNAQTWRDSMENNIGNFYDIDKSANDYFDSNPTLRNTAGNDYEEFIHWENFWRNRVAKYNSPPDFKYINQAFAQGLGNLCPGGTTASNWQPLGPFSQPIENGGGSGEGMGILNSIWVDANNSNIVYVGSIAGGLFKTTNGNSVNPTWVSLSDPTQPVMGVNSIAIDNNTNPATIYIATGASTRGQPGYSLGVLKSTDGGLTWPPNSTALSFTPVQQVTVRKIIMHPTNHNILYALSDKNQVYMTTDGGVTWPSINFPDVIRI